MKEIASHLRNLVTQNRFTAFFKYWQENVPSSSPLNQQADELKATWNKLEDDEISGVLDHRDAGTRRAQLVSGLLRLVNKLSEDDPETRTEPTPTPDPLQDLMRRKLAALKRERILATDASVKFRLDLEIEELEQQLK
jgi:hypothetical protein